MEAYTPEQLNILVLVCVYVFIIGGLIWSYSKPKK